MLPYPGRQLPEIPNLTEQSILYHWHFLANAKRRSVIISKNVYKKYISLAKNCYEWIDFSTGSNCKQSDHLFFSISFFITL